MVCSGRTELVPLYHEGLCYLWEQDAFLRRDEARYALERLWTLCAGTALWRSERHLCIPAIGRDGVAAMHRCEPGELPWFQLSEIVPPGTSLPLDTSSLPGLCTVGGGSDGAGRSAPFPFDLVAATFLLLTRWEETEVASEPDWRGNFRAACSLAARQGFLDRPVLDEWALVLRAWLAELCPGWQPRLRLPRIVMTHDVDQVHKFQSWFRVARAAAGTLLSTRQPVQAIRTARLGVCSRIVPQRDPYYRGLRSLLDLDEALGVRGVFFLMGADRARLDDGYDLSSPLVQPVIDEVLRRGHEVGWHPGYAAAEDPERFFREKNRVESRLGLPVRGARMHYLRWRPGHTWRLLTEAGIRYDSTLGFNETLGFRCGTSHPYPVWDLCQRKQIDLEERPLVAQDAAIYRALRLDHGQARAQLGRLWRRVQNVHGDLTVLIHNALSLELDDALEDFLAVLRP